MSNSIGECQLQLKRFLFIRLKCQQHHSLFSYFISIPKLAEIVIWCDVVYTGNVVCKSSYAVKELFESEFFNGIMQYWVTRGSLSRNPCASFAPSISRYYFIIVASYFNCSVYLFDSCSACAFKIFLALNLVCSTICMILTFLNERLCRKT